jgi:hypothetical protein
MEVKTTNGLRCFHFTGVVEGFDMARTTCGTWDRDVGDFAASVHTRAEVDLLVANDYSGWIGMVRPSGSGFRWESGDPIVGTFWGTDEPATGATQNCVRQDEVGEWAALNCALTFTAICAREIWPSFVP